jgi:membrane-bound lytic murein transglycosylase D
MLAVAPARRAQAAEAAGVDFPVPASLEPAVRFWVDVFTRYTRDDVIVHDRREPWLVHQIARAEDAERAVLALDAAEARLRLASLWLPPDGGRLLVPLEAEVTRAPRVRWQRGMRETFAQGLGAGRLYRPLVERALAREGLPSELAALPLIESSYHPGAVSMAGAVGLWQFTRLTGSRYLKITDDVDERHDPVLSSAAAARHLRELRAALPSWPLALTAYNHGLGGIQRARAELASDDVAVVVTRYHGPGFGFASRNFYAEFLAALHVSRNVESYFPELGRARVLEVRVKPGDTIDTLARRHGISTAELRATNGLRSAALQPGQRLLITPRDLVSGRGKG